VIRDPDSGMPGSAEVALVHVSNCGLVLGVCSELPYGVGIVPQGEGVEPFPNDDPDPADECRHLRHLSNNGPTPLPHLFCFCLGADVDPCQAEGARDAGVGGAKPRGCAERQGPDIGRLNGDLRAELLQQGPLVEVALDREQSASPKVMTSIPGNLIRVSVGGSPLSGPDWVPVIVHCATTCGSSIAVTCSSKRRSGKALNKPDAYALRPGGSSWPETGSA